MVVRGMVSSSMVVRASTNGTPISTAENSSGAMFVTAPIKRPPAERPSMASLSGLVYFSCEVVQHKTAQKCSTSKVRRASAPGAPLQMFNSQGVRSKVTLERQGSLPLMAPCDTCYMPCHSAVPQLAEPPLKGQTVGTTCTKASTTSWRLVKVLHGWPQAHAHNKFVIIVLLQSKHELQLELAPTPATSSAHTRTFIRNLEQATKSVNVFFLCRNLPSCSTSNSSMVQCLH